MNGPSSYFVHVLIGSQYRSHKGDSTWFETYLLHKVRHRWYICICHQSNCVYTNFGVCAICLFVESFCSCRRTFSHNYMFGWTLCGCNCYRCFPFCIQTMDFDGFFFLRMVIAFAWAASNVIVCFERNGYTGNYSCHSALTYAQQTHTCIDAKSENFPPHLHYKHCCILLRMWTRMINLFVYHICLSNELGWRSKCEHASNSMQNA